MADDDDLLIFPRHLRQAKICNDGGRQWFAIRGWSWAVFVERGRPLKDFRETGCPFAARVCEAAREEANRGR